MAFKKNTTNIDSNYITKEESIEKYVNIDPAYKNPIVYGVGNNVNGFLVLGDSTNRSSPVLISALSGFKTIMSRNPTGTTNMQFALGIKTDGTLWSWGYNSNGQLGLGTVSVRSSPTQVGTLNDWKVAYSFSGNVSSFAIKTDGTLWTWGRNDNGELGIGDTISRSSPVQVGNLKNWKELSSGTGPTLAVKTDGTLWAWGNNVAGGLGLGDTNHRSSPVQVGSLTDWKTCCSRGTGAFAIKTDGTLWAWGANSSGSLGLGDITNRSSPVQVGNLTNWKKLTNSTFSASGTTATHAIKTDGTLWAWGSNTNGSLGLGDLTTRSSPVQVGSDKWLSVSIDHTAVIGIKTDGTLWAWGNNSSGSLGLGDQTNRSSPTQIGTATNWKMADGQFFIADGLEE